MSGFGVDGGGQFGGYVEGYNTRSRLVEQQAHPALTSELEGDKMVLKINKPPRYKDSLLSLSWQCCSWIVSVSSPFKHCLQPLALGP